MKVAILARGIGGRGGVARVIQGYAGNMPQAAPGDEFYVITDSALPERIGGGNVREVRLRNANAALFDHVLVPRALGAIRPDVLLATKNAVPLFVKRPVAVVFHDLAYFARPESYGLADNIYMRAMFKRSARHAARIVAVSEWTREDVRRYLGKAAHDKTRTVHSGIDPAFRVLSDDERAAARRRLPALPARFILYAGNITPRKNIERLLEACASLEAGIGVVLTGHKSWKAERLDAAVGELSKTRDVRILGGLDDEAVAALYNLAEASVYPSLYEGFGFPVLESFACGAPVAASNATAIPEIAGGAALLFDPSDTLSIAGALGRIVEDGQLREDLRTRGLARAREFSWRRAAEEVLAILREVA